MKIQNKILISFLMVLLITFIIISALSYRNIRNHFINDTNIRLQEITENVANKLNQRTSPDFEQIIRPSSAQINPLDNQVILVVNKNNRVLYSSNSIIFKAGQQLKAEAIKRRIARLQNQQLLYNGRNYLSQVKSFKLKDQESEYRIISLVDLTEVNELIRRLFIAQIRGIVLISIFAVIVSIILSRSLVSPLTKLRDYANNLSASGTAEQISISTGDEIQELANSLNKMANRVYEYDQAQKKLLQNVSHELKSPLMSIQGYAEGIMDGVIEGHDIHRSLGIISEESQRLKRLVNEIIYLSKLETLDGFYNFNNIDLSLILRSSIDKVMGIVLNRDLSIDITAQSCLMKGDEEKLTQAFINVLSNSLRHGSSNVFVSLESNPKAQVIIRDDGKGFSDEDLKHLFTRFYNGPEGESGLGLSITKAIIEKHRGTITAQNHKDGGAMFIITFQ